MLAFDHVGDSYEGHDTTQRPKHAKRIPLRVGVRDVPLVSVPIAYRIDKAQGLSAVHNCCGIRWSSQHFVEYL